MSTSTLILIGIVTAVLLVSGFIMYLIKKFKGLEYVNVAVVVLTAVETALNNAKISLGKYSDIEDLIITALTYVQSICTNTTSPDIKAEKALVYVKDLAEKFSISITVSDETVIVYVLKIGFFIMDALGLDSSTSYIRLYSKMANRAGIEKSRKSIGVKSVKLVQRKRG